MKLRNDLIKEQQDASDSYRKYIQRKNKREMLGTKRKSYYNQDDFLNELLLKSLSIKTYV